MARSDMRGRRAHRGFTYLWVLMLVAFMGIALTIAAQIDSTSARRERERELLAIGRQFQTALGRYYDAPLVAGKREYPVSLDELLQDRRVPGIRRHLRKVFVDPLTGKSEWGAVLIGGRIVAIHSLSARMPIKQDGFDPELSHFRGKQKYSEWVFAYQPELLGPDMPGREQGTALKGMPDNNLIHGKDQTK
jgi:hypothetical protein